MKKVIWSLFDSETAITKKLNSDEYIVYSIGLPSSSAITDNFIKMDLSRKSCLKKLEKLPKPDIIFASPPCETWVAVSIGNVRFYKKWTNEWNLYWKVDFKPNKFRKVFEERRILGQKTAYFTAEIIKKFKPDLWCVENGSSSLIFKYLYKYHNLKGCQNKTFYSSYDNLNFSKKPTVIYSNKIMNLRQDHKRGMKVIEAVSSKKHKPGVKYLKDYSERSAVPIQLYQHILELHEGKSQLTFF